MTTTTNGEQTNRAVIITEEAKQKIYERYEAEETENADTEDLSLIESIDIASALYLLFKHPDIFDVKLKVEKFMGEPRAEYYLIDQKGRQRWIVYSPDQYIFASVLVIKDGSGEIDIGKALNILANNSDFVLRGCTYHNGATGETFSSFYLTRKDVYDYMQSHHVYAH